jgi:hypothetical protein
MEKKHKFLIAEPEGMQTETLFPNQPLKAVSSSLKKNLKNYFPIIGFGGQSP